VPTLQHSRLALRKRGQLRRDVALTRSSARHTQYKSGMKTEPQTMSTIQAARYDRLRQAGYPAKRALMAARSMIGASEGKRGPRAPFIQYGK